MPKLKIKPEFADTPFGFNGFTAPLGTRNDLHLLLADAKYHQVQEILNMFEDVPDDEDLQEIKANQLKKSKKKAKDPNDQTDEIAEAIENGEKE